MKEYLLLFWNQSGNGQYEVDPEKMKEGMHAWQQWIGQIASQGKLISTKPIFFQGDQVRNDGHHTSPTILENQLVTGYLLCQAESKTEVIQWAESCPILQSPGGFTEIREIAPFEL